MTISDLTDTDLNGHERDKPDASRNVADERMGR